MDPAVFWCTVRRVVGISGIRQGEIVAERYRVIERLTRLAVADSALTGVEYEYWLALDETRGAEVWIQVAESRGVLASGAQLAGVISSLRRLNHPAVPAVLDFGEIEVEAVEDGEEGLEESIVAGVGYVVLEPVEAESLATVLLRAALTEAEIFAVLIGIADILKVLHEVELVHGHLSAYSFLLGERSVLLVDLAAALALEVASESELTPAADVYALAWLACIALAGVDAVEAEFGVGYDAGSSPESLAAPQLLTIDLIERRRAWAEANLVATYGLRAELAALLVAALGEAGARPTVSELAIALRRREEVAGVGMAAVGAAAVGAAIVAAEMAEAVEAVEVAEELEAVEVEAAEAEAVEAAEIEVVEAAEAVAGAAALESAAAVGSAGAVEVAEAEVAEAEVVETEASRAGELVGAGVGVGVGSMGIGAEALSAGGRASRGSGGGGGTATAVASAPISPSSSPSGKHGSPPRRPRSAFYVALGIVGALIIAGIAYGCASNSSPNSATPAAPRFSPSGSPTSPGQSSGGGGGASPSTTAGQSAGAGVTPGASGSAAASPGGAASASAGSQASGQASSPAAPGYTPTPLATVPASPSQAIKQIQQTVSKAESAGQIPQQAQSSLNHAVSTLQHEIASGASVQLGLNALQKALNSNGVPSGFVTQLNELIPYLVAHQGS